ncbi:MAG: hypothetical protein ACJ79V_09535 [Myxococcales bacterium]
MVPAETVTNQNALPLPLSEHRSRSTFAVIAVASLAAAAMPIGALAEAESISSDESLNASVQQYRVPASERGTWHNPYLSETRALAAGEQGGGRENPSPTHPRCSTLTERDRAVVARLPRDLVEDVTALVEDAPAQILASWTTDRRRVLAGATVAVRPVPGLSAERLQRLVECGLAAAVSPGASDWIPLPAGVVPSVRSGGDRFLVDLRATDERDARVTLAAVQQLAPRQ